MLGEALFLEREQGLETALYSVMPDAFFKTDVWAIPTSLGGFLKSPQMSSGSFLAIPQKATLVPYLERLPGTM